ncbi:MAG TPA: hypothetical protein VKV36_12610 [Acidimicrobiales bacterium]|nr:hypothetical protein [Acidimicrobiales bacterium]
MSRPADPRIVDHLHRRDERGFGLIEVVIAFSVLMLALTPVAALLTNVIGQAANARERLTALSLAEQYIELLTNSGPHLSSGNLPITGTPVLETPTALVRSSVAYKVYSEFDWTAAEGTNPDLCTSGSVPKVLNLQVTVDWGANQSLTDTTVLNYPPAGIPTFGFLAVQVEGDPAGSPPGDAAGNPWSDRVRAVPVSLVSPPPPATASFTTTVYPDSYGCAFQQVPPGTYQVSVADPSPGVPRTVTGTYGTPSFVANANEQTAAAQGPLTVNVGQVTPVTFQYDEGSLVDLAYPSTTATEDGVTCPGAGAFLCLAAGQAPATPSAPAASPVAVLSVRTPAGWTVASLPGGLSRIEATACAGTVRCVAVGYGPAGGGGFQGASASAAPSSSPSFTADALPAGVTNLSGVTCPGASTCYAWGSGAAGAVILSATVSSGAVTWTADTGLAGVAAIAGIACPGSTTCYAIGSGASGAVIVSLDASGTNWVADTLPNGVTVSALSQVTCPGTATCYAIGSGSSGAVILSLGLGTAWVNDTVAGPPSALSQVACPGSTTCYAIGSGASGAVIVSVDSSGTNWVADTTPAGLSLAAIICPSTTSCYATGSGSSGGLIWSLSSATAWAADSLSVPPGATPSAVGAIACPAPSTCVAAASAASSALLLALGSGTTWSAATIPLTTPPVLFAGVACTGSTCEAAGASRTGALLLDGSSGGTSWSNGTPGNLTGMYLSDVPVSVSSYALVPSTIELTAPSTDATVVGPLFPFAAGYSIGAAECTAELSAASSLVSTTPGATSSAILPMGLLPLKVVNASGNPVAGASVTAVVNDPSCTPLTPLTGTNPSSFALETTGPDGLSRLDVMYDTYTVTATAGTLTGSVTVQVSPTGTTAGGVTLPLPSPVVVRIS